MPLVDILIWAILLIFVLKGFLKGLIREACSVLGLVGGGWAAFRYYFDVAESLRTLVRLPHNVEASLSFLLIFCLIGLLFFLLGHLLTVIFKIMLLNGINRIGGSIFGLLEGAFILCMLLYLGSLQQAPEKVRGVLGRSSTAQIFVTAGREMVEGWHAARSGQPEQHDAVLPEKRKHRDSNRAGAGR